MRYLEIKKDKKINKFIIDTFEDKSKEEVFLFYLRKEDNSAV